LAAYVYTADQAVTRCGSSSFDYGESWLRHFRFEVAVRCPEVWDEPAVHAALVETLGFLSGDHYEFGFTRHPDPPKLEGYLFGPETELGSVGFDEVLLFSGGLDSLGGAVQEALQCGRRVALVSHRPTDKVYARQRALAQAVSERVTDPRRPPLHVPLKVNKGSALSRDFNQRTRSFLFLAVAAVTSRALGLARVRAHENGVISLNLPISPQLLNARASRSTHPRFLKGFSQLCSLVFGNNFSVDNPFLWRTKAEVLSQIRAAGHGSLCAKAVSCGGTMAATLEHPHCGRCSQCVDRRLTALAAGLDPCEDPPQIYASDVLTGARDGTELTQIERYLGTALQISGMSEPREFVEVFPEVTRVIGHVGLPAARALALVFDLHRRHAGEIRRALSQAVEQRSNEIVCRQFPPNCLLSLACGRQATSLQVCAATSAGEPQSAPSLFSLDRNQFQAVWAGRPCFLGCTMEYRLLEHLNQRPGHFLPVTTIAEDVWGDAGTGKNTIQATVSNLRRLLRDAGCHGVVIDGSQRGHYRLTIQPDTGEQASA
jgi:7-cyano-7-deazaguanine synthase in queuosine biosynthesis